MALYSTTSGCGFVEKQWGSRVDLRWFPKSFSKFSGSGSANSPVQLCLSETEYSPIALLLYLWVIIIQFVISHNLKESTMDFMDEIVFFSPHWMKSAGWKIQNKVGKISYLSHKVIIIISIFYCIGTLNWCWHSSVQIGDCWRDGCRQTLQPR